MFYGRGGGKKLTNYQEEVNCASISLALENPTLLDSRQSLLKLAREKVNKSYRFKKGKSRSKLSQTDEPPSKRLKTSESMRETHINELKEDIKT